MSAECNEHGIHLVGMEDAYCPLCRCSELRAENERLREALSEQPDKWSFNTLVYIGQSVLEGHYPESVFTGSSGTPGPRFIVALRDALTALEPSLEAAAALSGESDGWRPVSQDD